MKVVYEQLCEKVYRVWEWWMIGYLVGGLPYEGIPPNKWVEDELGIIGFE